jgi:hypothetical protein
MNPVVIYVLVLAGVVVLAMIVRRLVVVPTRECYMCGARVPVTKRLCQSCGYPFETVSQAERKDATAMSRLSGRPSPSRSSASPRREAR